MFNELLHIDSLHHAYVVYGDHELVFNNLSTFLETEVEVELHGNPDLSIINEDVLTIDTVRSIVSSNARKALNGKKIYIIQSRVLTRESQNALLKVLEEPQPDTHFFILLNSEGSILPTLLSRVIEINMVNKNEVHADVTDFINSSLSQRLKLVDEIAKEKDRQRASRLIHGILHQRDRVKFSSTTLKALEIGSRYIDLPSSSVKMLLENIALKFSKK